MYREIEIDGFEPQAVADQAAPMLQWVEVADLVIDTSYQRELGRRNIAAIKAIAAQLAEAERAALATRRVELLKSKGGRHHAG